MKDLRQQLIEDIKLEGSLLRNMMDKEEIKLANKMVKEGILYKGTSDDRQGSVQFILNDK